MCFTGAEHMMSLVFDGVFVKYPGFRFVLNEYGTSWLPFVLWRMDMESREAREEVPWLTKLPSQYIKDSVRFTTQPLEEPENPRDLVTMLSLIGGDDLLIFSSDYPHWDSDSPDWALRAFPDDWKRKIYWENARAFYKLDERLAEVA